MKIKSRFLMAIMAVCLLVSALCIGLVACGHEHTFEDGWSHNDEYHWHAATCGDTDEVRDKAAHIVENWDVINAATYDSPGLEEGVCKVCKKHFERIIPQLQLKSEDIETEKMFELQLLDNATYGIKKYIGDKSEVVIPATYKDLIISSINDGAFEGSPISSIVIANSVIDITQETFLGCITLESVTIIEDNTLFKSQDGVVYNGSEIFFVPPALKGAIKILDGCINIKDNAFNNRKGLTSITISESVTDIGNSAFEGCTSLSSITIPMNVTRIGNNAFKNCRLLAEVNWEAINCTSVGKIDNDNDYTVFKNCTSLTTVTIADNVHIIPEYAFYNCFSLQEVTIGADVTSIGNNAFEGCTSLMQVIDADNDLSFISDGAILPATLTNIGEKAFYNCDALVTVAVYGDNVAIGRDAFGNMDMLYAIHWHAKNADITPNEAYGVFNESGSLIASKNYNNGLLVIIGNDVQTIDDYTFAGLDIDEISFVANSALQKIGEYAFANCKTLRSVENKPINIDEAETAFNGSTLILNQLKQYLSDKDTFTWDDFVFHKEDNGTYTLVGYNTEFIQDVVYLPNKVRIPPTGTEVAQAYNIAEYAFAYRKDGTFIISSAATSVDSNAFYGASGKRIQETIGERYIEQDGVLYKYNNGVPEIACVLDNISGDVKLLEGLQSINDKVFQGCKNIISITIPNSVTKIGERAFYNCTELLEVTMGAGMRVGGNQLGYSAFGMCNKIVHIRSLTGESLSIYRGNFRFTSVVEFLTDSTTPFSNELNVDKNGIRTYTVGKSVYAIGYAGNSSVLDLSLNKSINSIYDYAFRGCTGLQTVIIPESVQSIGDFAFEDCTGLLTVTIDEGVQSIGNVAFSGCTSLTSVTIPASVTKIGARAFDGCINLTSAIFENPNGWYCYANFEINLSRDLQDENTAARSLRYYRNYHWYRKDN